MEKNYNTFIEEYNKIQDDYENKLDNLKIQYSLDDVSKMVFEEYKEQINKLNIDDNMSLDNFIFDGYSDVINYFDLYDCEEIYNNIIHNYKIKKEEKVIEEEICIDDMLQFLLDNIDTIDEFFVRDYEDIVLKNGKFYGITVKQITNIE